MNKESEVIMYFPEDADLDRVVNYLYETFNSDYIIGAGNWDEKRQVVLAYSDGHPFGKEHLPDYDRREALRLAKQMFRYGFIYLREAVFGVEV